MAQRRLKPGQRSSLLEAAATAAATITTTLAPGRPGSCCLCRPRHQNEDPMLNVHDTYNTADEMEIIDYNIQPPEDHVGDLPHPGLLDDRGDQFGISRWTRGHSLV